jgi:hypothetical protein
MIKNRFNGEITLRMETCLEFRNADLKAFARHLHERRCEKCWAFFAATRQAGTHQENSAPVREASESFAAGSGHVSVGPSVQSLDRWLIKEYFLIPHVDRPIAGSNDWFRWLEEFKQRHPADVARLTEPLAQRALQVLWNPKR